MQYYEKLPAHALDDLNMDDIRFMFCDQIVVFDHVKQHMLLVGNVHVKDGATDEEIRQAYAATSEKLEQAAERLQQQGPERT